MRPLHPNLLSAGLFSISGPAAWVLLLSVVIGFIMVFVFRYTSDQKAIHVAKEQLKAHLLAVRLFQDQLPVVLSSYGGILRGTGRYLRLALKPLLIVILPLTFLIVQLDRYFGWRPFAAGEPFLVKVQADRADGLDEISLQAPPGIATTSPAVHVPSENEVIWRAVAERTGTYELKVQAGGAETGKNVAVAATLERLSPERLQAPYWKRMFVSGEPALPAGPIRSIAVTYPERTIAFAGLEWNWIWLFFVISLAAGLLFKSILGIEI